jgi:ribonuclease-3
MSEPASERESLEADLGHRFRDPQLLEIALAHPSHAHEVENGVSNERLEFLGDAVLGLVVAHVLYEAHPTWSEGVLTRARHALVNLDSLAARARALGLGRHVRLGRSELRTGGAEKDSILSDVFEALLGAVYLDAGLAAVSDVVRRCFGDALTAAAAAPERDPKTRLQEWAQARHHCIPVYRTLADSGVENDEERFEVEVRVGEEPLGSGRGRTKRGAERRAAEEALVHAATAAADA